MKLSSENMPPQRNVITLEEGQDRTNNWREAIKSIYGYDEDKVPKGFLIPLEDLQELVDYYREWKCVGVRAYFSLKAARDPDQSILDQIGAVLVPVYIDISSPDNPVYRDIIIPVPSESAGEPAKPAQLVSIYDVTRPCPPLCDPKSQLD